MYEDISIAEVNLALQNLLEGKVTTVDPFGKERAVPVYFRDRDSKMIADSRPKGMIEISWVANERAESAYQNQCYLLRVIDRDENDYPIQYQAVKSPDAIWLTYTITASSDNWNDVIKMQSMLDKVFPVNHTVLNVNGFKTHMKRDGFTPADDEELGIFIRDFNLRILGYIFGLDCVENKIIIPAIRDVDLEVTATSDPDSNPIEIIRIISE